MNMAGGAMGGGFNAAQQFYNMGTQQQQQPNTAPVANGWQCSSGATSTGKFCPECGNPKPVATEWTCSCGSVNSGKFCSNCGSRKPEVVRCAQCGWQPEDPARKPKFCPECGKPF